MINNEVAEIFDKIATYLEIKQENPFRIRSYQKASQTLAGLTQDVSHIYKEGGLQALQEISGIGEALALKIEEMVKTGKLKFLEDLKKEFPEGMDELLSVPGMGPKTVLLVHEKLGIKNLHDLEAAAKEHRIQALPRLGPKVEENILKGIAIVKKGQGRTLLGEALPVAQEIQEALKKSKLVMLCEIGGSLRRGCETVGDIDLLAVSRKAEEVMEFFTQLPQVKQVIAKGETKSSVRLEANLQVDLRVVEAKDFGAALCYFTGSKQHNIILRERAIKMGLKLSEYGVFKGAKRVAGNTEEEVYQALKLPYIPPELRESRGEIEAAEKGNLPRLIQPDDLKGDCHVHTSSSDGAGSLEEMARAAIKRGYSYICVTDHSQGLAIANGLTPARLKKQAEEVRKLNKSLKNFTIFHGSEVDIKEDGSLDLPDSCLKELAYAVGSVHSHFKLTAKQMTARICRAMQSPYLSVLGHPTGRLFGSREPYEMDWETVFRVARETGTALEINASPWRLDLNDVMARAAKEAGVKLVINTDSHQARHFEWMLFGVLTARRAWLEKKDVLNTLEVKEFREFVGKKRG